MKFFMYITVISFVSSLELLDPPFPEYYGEITDSYEYNNTESHISTHSSLLNHLNNTLDFIIQQIPFIFHGNEYTTIGKIKIIILELVIIIMWFAIIRSVVKHCWFILRRHQYVIEQPENPNAEPQINNELPDGEVHGQYNFFGEPSTSTSTTPEKRDNKFEKIKTRPECSLSEEPQPNRELPIELHELHGKYTSKSKPGSSSQEITKLEDKPKGLYLVLRREYTSSSEPGPSQETQTEDTPINNEENEKEDTSK